MKKTISNIRTLAALLMAGAAFAACSNSDDIISEQPANTVKQGYTLTVSASKDGSTTRALTDNDGAIEASWQTTDVIHVTQADGTEIGTLSPTNIDGLNATFTGTISGDAEIAVDDVLTLTYHPVTDFATQDGTLSGSANSAENYDMAVATVTISAITGKTIVVSESRADFANQTAVVVLRPYNSGWDQYANLTSLTVLVTVDIPSVGTVKEQIGPFTLSGSSPYYFALPSQDMLAGKIAAEYSLNKSEVSTLLASATVSFTGPVESIINISCGKTGYKFAAGKYYKLDKDNFSMTLLQKWVAADKDVYISQFNIEWSNTVTYAVNIQNGWRIVGDYVYWKDQQLLLNGTKVEAKDDFILPFEGTYSLRDPEPAPPTLAQTMTTAGMTVKVNYNYSGENYCQFRSNGDGTYTFQSGDGWVGGYDGSAKALVVEDGKLVFKQNNNNPIDNDWNVMGYSVTFDTSNNTYSEWSGVAAAGNFNPSFISVEVNGTTINVAAVPEGALAGKFCVSAGGDQVYFSKGNLKYNSSAWSFFDNQYDYLTTHDGTNWDKFGWSTSTTTYGMSTSTDNGSYSGDFVDWGATMGTGWRALTSDEWTYLFNTRASGSTVFGTSNARYAHATINTDGTGVNGVILFPDGVTIANTEVTTAGTVNGTSDWATKCTSAEWTALESKGCVFLPAAGDRNGSLVSNAGSSGYYWSSTADGAYLAYHVYFVSDVLYPANDSYDRFEGHSVRLVREVTE